MPKVSDLDKFIELSTDFLATNPSINLSITYTNIAKKNKDDKISKSDRKPTNSVNFKLFEPNTGKCLKYNTTKSKELSKLLNFIGPKGLSDQNSQVLGLASLMTNVKYEQEDTTIVEKESTPTPQVLKKKNKKKKKKN